MRQLVLSEYETLERVALEPAELALLLGLQKELDLEIAPDFGRQYKIRANARVGVVQTPDFRLQINPKIPISNLFFILAYASGLKLWPDFQAEYEASADIYEILALCFARAVSQLLRQGILQGYRTEEEALNTLRGRIDFARQIRENYGRIPPLNCEYQLFTEDIPENQVLLATLEVLTHAPFRHPKLNHQLRLQARQMGGVSRLHRPLHTLSLIQESRLNQRYMPALSLAHQILSHAGFSENLGGVKASSFIVDMNKAFEDFIVVALREALQLDEKTFPQNGQGHPLFLDYGGKVKLEPDLSWWQGKDCKFVGDVKYKKTDKGRAKREDIYQMLAYLDATKLDWGMFVYAESKSPPEVYNLKSDKQIEVFSVDLDTTPAEILLQIEQAAGLIRMNLKQIESMI